MNLGRKYYRGLLRHQAAPGAEHGWCGPPEAGLVATGNPCSGGAGLLALRTLASVSSAPGLPPALDSVD